uniref:Uncharacterized protein n=1 Tax=Helobdella robusta TaxID=6412 RepID=T1FZP4_HELRO
MWAAFSDTISTIPKSETILIGGDLNGHVGKKKMVLTMYMTVLAIENEMKMATASLSLLKITGFVY